MNANHRRHLAALLLVSVFFPLGLAAVPADANILTNPGFEDRDDPSSPIHWQLESWNGAKGQSQIGLDREIKHGGQSAVRLSLPQNDDARLVQNTAVEPNRLYKLSAWVKTKDVTGGVGASIGANDSLEHSTTLSGTSDWTLMEAYGRTTSGQTTLPFGLRLGHFGNLASGTVWFDDVAVVPITELPSGASAIKLYAEQAASPGKALDLGPVPGILAGLGLSALWVGLAFWITRRRYAPASLESNRLSRGVLLAMLLVATAVLVIKLVLAGVVLGYKEDMGTFAAWSNDLAEKGPIGFYHDGYFADYPPLYLYVLWAIGGIIKFFGLGYGTPLATIVIKLPAILADLALALVTFAYLRKIIDTRLALAAGFIALCSPLSLVDSSLWGQVDSVFVLVIVASWIFLDRQRLAVAALFFAIAVGLKPQAIIAMPVILVALGKQKKWPVIDIIAATSFVALSIGWLVVKILSGRGPAVTEILLYLTIALNVLVLIGAIFTKRWRSFGLSVLVFEATFILTILPFAFNLTSEHSLVFKEPDWIFKLYLNTLGSYEYLSLNAFSLPALFGGNGVATDSILLGLPAKIWAWASFVPVVVYLGYLLIRGRGLARFWFSAAALYLAFFVLVPKMHERYLFPAAFLFLMAAFIVKDRRLWLIALGVGISSFWNIFYLLEGKLRADISWLSATDPVLLIGSLLNVVLLAWSLIVGYQVLIRQKTVDLPQAGTVNPAPPPPKQAIPEPRLDLPGQLGRPAKRVFIGLGIVVFVYGAVALWNLGNTKAPQTFWGPRTDSTAIFDLGSKQTVTGVAYYVGLRTGSYLVDWSDDAQTWSNPTKINNDNQYAEMRWRTIVANADARYLRVQNSGGTLELMELHLLGTPAQPKLILAKPSQSETNGPQNLFDEPQTYVDSVSYFDGMYFDEIYHAKSAWEMLRGYEASENTHPPLGKIIIGFGIKIFGMTPFGYRIMGVLFGILMLPFIFGLARRLTGRDDFGLLATVFFALDFMHFTQTRIATIDTYIVFFALAAYYFMLRYLQTPAEDRYQPQATKWIFASGIAIGLCIASKWNGFYAALGLAIIYIVDCFHRPTRWWLRNSGLSLVAFVAIPLVIYLMAYIPMLSVQGNSLQNVLDNQKSMWDYHSHLDDTHPYSSKWYEWPVMAKPIWYYSGSDHPAGTISTIEAFGNPVVWFLGAFSILLLLVFATGQTVLNIQAWRRKHQSAAAGKGRKGRKDQPENILDASQTWILAHWPVNRSAVFVIIAALAQYLPWARSSRQLLFIYHYFPTVPFLALALTLVGFYLMKEGKRELPMKVVWWSLAGLAVLMFFVFFPLISGATVPRIWGELLESSLRFWGGVHF